MQKSKGIIVFFIIILLLIVIAVSFIIKSNPKDLTIKMYDSIAKNDKVTITLDGKEDEYYYRTIMSKKDEDVSIDTYTKYEDEEQHVATLIKDGYIYTILHDDQEYMYMDAANVDLENLIPEKKDIDGKTYKKGREEISGSTFYYEEYENILTFLMLVEAHEDAKVKTRFYYDNKNNLVYVKNIIQDEDDEFEELINVNIKFEIDEKLFQIPEEYAESQDQ